MLRVRLDRGDMMIRDQRARCIKQIKNSFSSQGGGEVLVFGYEIVVFVSSSSTYRHRHERQRRKTKLNGVNKMPAPEDASMEKKDGRTK